MKALALDPSKELYPQVEVLLKDIAFGKHSTQKRCTFLFLMLNAVITRLKELEESMTVTAMAQHQKHAAPVTDVQKSGMEGLDLTELRPDAGEAVYESDRHKVVIYLDQLQEGQAPPPFILIEQK